MISRRAPLWTPPAATVALEVGTRIYTTGDMANPDGFGVVTAVSEYDVTIAMDDGRTKNVPPASFSAKFLGTGATRFVTEAAAREFWAQRDAAIVARMNQPRD